MCSRNRKAVGYFSVQRTLGKLTISHMTSIVKHIIGNHVSDLSFGKMIFKPLCHSLELRFIFSIVC